MSSTPSSTSTHTLRMSIPPLSPTITHIAISHLHFKSIFLQALHPLFNVVCHCRGPVCLGHSSRASWLSGLSSLFLTVSVMSWWPFCTVPTNIPTWASHPAQLTGLAKWNPTSLASPRGSPSWSYHHPKIRLPPQGLAPQLSFCNSFFKAILKHVSN